MEELFRCISWGSHFNSGLGLGLIAGGMQDGSLMLWEAGAYINPKEDYGNGLVCNMELYKPGEFNCLEWSPFKKEMLCTGGSDVYIVNIEKGAEEPDVFCPGNKKENDSITSVSWNKNKTVPHILASGSSSGIINVWDLKQKKSIFSFRDKNSDTTRDVRVSWNPSIPTQLAVVFDDAKDSGVQIWDLRNSKAPVIVLKDLHKNSKIHSLSWSTLEPNNIITVDRSGLVCCQDYKSSDVILQESCSKDMVSVQWSNQLQSIFVSNDIDGNLSFHTTDTSMLKKITTTHAPKWMKNPACVATTLNSAISFKETGSELGSTTVAETVETDLQHKLKTLMVLIENNDMNTFAHHYSKESPDLWHLISKGEHNVATAVHGLGFDSEDIVNKTETLIGKSHRKKDNKDQVRRASNPNKMGFEFKGMEDDQAADFFRELGNTEQGEEPVNKGNFYNSQTEEVETKIVRNENWDAGIEDLIRRNIIIGNFHGAIDCAIKAGRYAHAFLIAYSKKEYPELLLAAAEGISLLNNDPLSRLLHSMIDEQFEDTIQSHDIYRWKELAAFIISNYPQNKDHYLRLLSQRLEKSDMMDEAIGLCLISGDYDSLFEIVKTSIKGKSGSEIDNYLLRNFTVLFAINRTNGVRSEDNDIQSALVKLSHIMIENEQFKLAMHFLEELGDHTNEKISFLKNCIFYSNVSLLHMFFKAPTYEFTVRVRQPISTPAKAKPTEQPKNSKIPIGSPAVDTKKGFPKPKIGGASASVRATEDDNQSLNSEADLRTMNERMPPGGRMRMPPPQIPTSGTEMAKKEAPNIVKPNPHPPPAPRIAPPVPAGPTRPPPNMPKPSFAGRSTDEIVEQIHSQGQAGPPKKAGPPPPPIPRKNEDANPPKSGVPVPAMPSRPAGPPPPAPPRQAAPPISAPIAQSDHVTQSGPPKAVPQVPKVSQAPPPPPPVVRPGTTPMQQASKNSPPAPVQRQPPPAPPSALKPPAQTTAPVPVTAQAQSGPKTSSPIPPISSQSKIPVPTPPVPARPGPPAPPMQNRPPGAPGVPNRAPPQLGGPPRATALPPPTNKAVVPQEPEESNESKVAEGLVQCTEFLETMVVYLLKPVYRARDADL